MPEWIGGGSLALEMAEVAVHRTWVFLRSAKVRACVIAPA
jgi:hypothetical protein